MPAHARTQLSADNRPSRPHSSPIRSLRRYSYGAVALNYFASALMMLEAILFIGACQQVFWNENHTRIQLDMPLLIDASFCAASGMIAFGAIIGKCTPTQLLWIMFAQVPLYAFNQV